MIVAAVVIWLLRRIIQIEKTITKIKGECSQQITKEDIEQITRNKAEHHIPMEHWSPQYNGFHPGNGPFGMDTQHYGTNPQYYPTNAPNYPINTQHYNNFANVQNDTQSSNENNAVPSTVEIREPLKLATTPPNSRKCSEDYCQPNTASEQIAIPFVRPNPFNDVHATKVVFSVENSVVAALEEALFTKETHNDRAIVEEIFDSVDDVQPSTDNIEVTPVVEKNTLLLQD